MRCLRVLLMLVLGLTVFAQVSASPEIRLPPTSGVFDYQLGAAYDVLPDGQAIDVVVRDASVPPLQGAYNVCYVNGFQTQPGELADWPEDVLLRDQNGALVSDPEWPDEYILDPSTFEQFSAIQIEIAPLIEKCAAAGFDAVEIDNLDTFLRFPLIDPNGALALANWYIEFAHDHGLAIAQKNTPELANLEEYFPDLAVALPEFDFAIVEECAAFDECEIYRESFGDHVLQIEYQDSLAEIDFNQVCAEPNRAPLTILRDRNLVSPGHQDYLYESCAVARAEIG